MAYIFRDLKIAVRHLIRSPGFATAALLILALGIGATTAIFSMVEGVLLRPLPFPQSDQIMVISDTLSGVDMPAKGSVGVTPTDIRNYTHGTHSFTSLGGYQRIELDLSGIGYSAKVSATRMSGGVFPALAVEPLRGRFFTLQEDEQNEPVVVISFTMWENRFHGDPNVLGKKLLLNRRPYVIVGVMPQRFEFPLLPGHINHAELWIPISFAPQDTSITAASDWSYDMVGRLKAGITAAQALNDLDGVAAETVRAYPASMAEFKMHPVIRPLYEETVEQARPLIRMLFLAVVVAAS